MAAGSASTSLAWTVPDISDPTASRRASAAKKSINYLHMYHECSPGSSPESSSLRAAPLAVAKRAHAAATKKVLEKCIVEIVEEL